MKMISPTVWITESRAIVLDAPPRRMQYKGTWYPKELCRIAGITPERLMLLLHKRVDSWVILEGMPKTTDYGIYDPLALFEALRDGVTVGGVHKSFHEWASVLGIHPTSLRHRFKYGWPIERIFSMPRSHRGRKRKLASASM